MPFTGWFLFIVNPLNLRLFEFAVRFQNLQTSHIIWFRLENGVSMEDVKLFTKLQKFFALVELHESEIQNLIKEARKPIHSITNQTVFYRAAAGKDSLRNTPFEKIVGFREGLIDNILTSLQVEYDLLEEIRDKINAANEKLHEEETLIQSLYANLRSKNLINYDNLNSCCPSLEHVVDWCHDIWCYYHSYYLQISQALLKLNYEDENSVKALFQSFKEDPELKKRINRIRSFKFNEFEFTYQQ